MKRLQASKYKSTKRVSITKVNRIGGINVMVELAKPLSYGFIVREDKVEDFLNHKRDKSKLERVLMKASKNRKNIGVHE